MTKSDDNGPAAFFNAMTAAFDATIRTYRDQPQFVGVLCAQAFDSFDGNVEIQAEGAPAIACKGDCPACCVLRVAATAPEVFLLARFVLANAAGLAERGVNLQQRIAETSSVVGGHSERERMALRRECPFMEAGHCLAYRVRPLACCGHASYDEGSCTEAIAGEREEAAISEPHLVVRSLVQNAMMSSVHAAGLAWRLYELIQALDLALSIPEAEAKWVRGQDPLLSAAIAEFDMREAAVTFEAMRAGSTSGSNRENE
jgi:hypothetical protein